MPCVSGQPYILVSLSCILGYYAYLKGWPLLAGDVFRSFRTIQVFSGGHAHLLCMPQRVEDSARRSSRDSGRCIRKHRRLRLEDSRDIPLICTRKSSCRQHSTCRTRLPRAFSRSIHCFVGCLYSTRRQTHSRYSPGGSGDHRRSDHQGSDFVRGGCHTGQTRAKSTLPPRPRHPSALLGILTLLLAPATATYHFVLLWLPVGLLIDYLFRERSPAKRLLRLGTYALIGFFPYRFTQPFEGRGALTVLAYPRLFLLLAMFIACVYIHLEHAGTRLEKLRPRRLEASYKMTQDDPRAPTARHTRRVRQRCRRLRRPARQQLPDPGHAR